MLFRIHKFHRLALHQCTKDYIPFEVYIKQCPDSWINNLDLKSTANECARYFLCIYSVAAVTERFLVGGKWV